MPDPTGGLLLSLACTGARDKTPVEELDDMGESKDPREGQDPWDSADPKAAAFEVLRQGR